MQKIFDSHFHIIDPGYPLFENQGFLPDFFTVEEYQSKVSDFGIELVGGVVVSGSFQGFDCSYFQGALDKLGATFVGVTQLNPYTKDEEILRLDRLGIKGIRFNLFRGLSASVQDMRELAHRVYCLCGWKTELYVDASKIDEQLATFIFELPKVSIDHLGMRKCQIERLEQFVSGGIPIRVTGFGRVDYSRDEVQDLLIALYKANPQALIFGTDMPSTRAKYPFSLEDLTLIKESLGEEKAQDVLYKNGVAWYLS